MRVADVGDLGGEDYLIAAQTVALGGRGVVERGDDHGFHHDVAGIQRLCRAGVVIHHAGEQGLVERTPVDADADGLPVVDGTLDHGAEIVIVFATDRHVAGVDAVLGEGAGAGGVFAQKDVTVVMEVTDDRRVPAFFLEAFDDVGNGFGGVVVVDGDADEFGAGAGEGGYLLNRGFDVGGVGVGHRLHDDGSLGTYTDSAYVYGDGTATQKGRHTSSSLAGRIPGTGRGLLTAVGCAGASDGTQLCGTTAAQDIEGAEQTCAEQKDTRRFGRTREGRGTGSGGVAQGEVDEKIVGSAGIVAVDKGAVLNEQVQMVVCFRKEQAV